MDYQVPNHHSLVVGYYLFEDKYRNEEVVHYY